MRLGGYDCSRGKCQLGKVGLQVRVALQDRRGGIALRRQMKSEEQAYLCVDLVLVRRLTIAYDNEQVAQNSSLR